MLVPCEERGYQVVKANDLIQKSSYLLPLSSQKLFAFICSMIKPPDPTAGIPPPDRMIYSFDIRKYCIICGINYTNGGKTLAYVKQSLKRLADYSVYIKAYGEREVLCRWLDEVVIDKKSFIATVRIGKHLAPYLLDLSSRFTSYQLINILPMKSAYSIRLYEIIKSYQFQHEVKINTDDIRKYVFTKTARCNRCPGRDSEKCFECDEYKNYYRDFTELRRRVIDVAVNEINTHTDIKIEMKPHKFGRSVSYVTFSIRENTFEESFQTWLLHKETLGLIEEEFYER